MQTKVRTPLQKVLDTLPSRHGVIRAAEKALAEKGHTVSRRSLYEVVKGRIKTPAYVEAILDAAEAAKKRAAELNERAEQLAKS